MGTDNLFYKRKVRKAEMHRRKIASRSPYDRVLIACEGEKTEPHYFRWLINNFKLNRQNVVIADCDKVVSDLRKYIPEYEKGSRDFLKCLNSKTDEAITRAKQIETYHETSGTDNPFTKMYILVEYLKSLKR